MPPSTAVANGKFEPMLAGRSSHPEALKSSRLWYSVEY